MPQGIPGSSPTEALARKAATQRAWQARNPEKIKEYKRRFGHSRYRYLRVTLEEWETLLSVNDGLCWSCLDAPATQLDHDHVTGEIRGPLCAGCNMGLGSFKDDPDRLINAVAYLGAPNVT